MITDLFRKKMLHLDEVNSTNSYAENLLKKHKPEQGSIIFAHKQTHGKGLDQNQWETADNKNLILSYIVYPSFLEISEQFFITVMTSLAVRDFLLQLEPSLDVKIKWPNDIYIGKGKIAGILIQNAIMGPHLDHSIIGIGLNLNQLEFISGAPNPISLANLTQKTYPIEWALNTLAACLDKRYQEIQNKALWPKLEQTYLNHLFQYKQRALYQILGEEKYGIIEGVDEFGRLVMSFREEKTQIFDLKEVKFIL